MTLRAPEGLAAAGQPTLGHHAIVSPAVEEFDAPAGTLVLLEPGEHRVAQAVEPATVVLAVGAEGKRFTTSAWEASFRAHALTDLGRPEEARAAIAEGLTAHPEIEFHSVRARVAAAAVTAEGAREQLRLGCEADPGAAARAARDPLLADLVPAA
jgi:hypothetical protein